MDELDELFKGFKDIYSYGIEEETHEERLKKIDEKLKTISILTMEIEEILDRLKANSTNSETESHLH